MSLELSVHDLGLWRGDRRLCCGLSFRVAGGTLLQLTGANGSGKTTLLRALAGLGRVDEGEVRWNSEPIRHSEDYRRFLAYLGHHNGLKNHLSPSENYIFYQRLAGISSEIGAKDALSRFGLDTLQDRPTGLLSMGQKRRAALARLLAVRARLWLLDEPLTGLDAAGIELMGELLERHLEEGGLAVVATHQPLPVAGAQRLLLGGEP